MEVASMTEVEQVEVRKNFMKMKTKFNKFKSL